MCLNHPGKVLAMADKATAAERDLLAKIAEMTPEAEARIADLVKQAVR